MRKPPNNPPPTSHFSRLNGSLMPRHTRTTLFSMFDSQQREWVFMPFTPIAKTESSKHHNISIRPEGNEFYLLWWNILPTCRQRTNWGEPRFRLWTGCLWNIMRFEWHGHKSGTNNPSPTNSWAHKAGANLPLFRSITMLSGTDNILQNISHIQCERWNIPKNIVNLREHCYRS